MDNTRKKFRFNNEIFINFVKWSVLSMVSGSLVGIVISSFLKSLEFATSTRESNPWLLYLLPLGGALVSYLYFKYGKDSSKGNNLIIERVNKGSGEVPFRMAPLVFLGTFITHLFGGSAGREGTGVQIGASISAKIGRILRLNDIDKNLIIISGISSGFGVVFGTPIAGTIFGLEVSRTGKMRYEAIIPALISSFTGNEISKLLNVHHTHYKMATPIINTLKYNNNYSIFFKVIVCAILFGLTSKLFAELTHFLKAKFSNKISSPMIKSFVGGAIVIILTILVGSRDYLGLSLDLLGDSFVVNVMWYSFLLKLMFTSLTLATGFQGGEVTPLFVIGATLGNFLSRIISLPLSFTSGLGMIGVFCGATKTPLASFAMGIELFGSGNIQYLFIVCVISYVFAGKSTIYTSQENFVNINTFK